MKCRDCKYLDVDYIFDEEIGEEYPFHQCTKKKEEIDDYDSEIECDCFKKIRQNKYVEEDTKCDLCKDRSGCELIDITTMHDTRRHVIGGLLNCKYK